MIVLGITLTSYAQNHTYHYGYRMVRLDSTYDAQLDPDLSAFLVRHKARLDKKMNEVIGHCPTTLNVESPKSPLSDLIIELMLKEGPAAINQAPCDLSMMNFGGIRTNIQAGDVTVGDIFEISPFDNHFVVVTLKGSELKKAVNRFRYDQLMACNAGMEISYKDNVPYRVLVQGKELQDNQLYRLITLDFISEGGDDILSGIHYENVEYTNIIFRDFLINQIKAMTKRGEELK